jgi:tRNA-specific 2-thiouridylase
MRVLCAMSGGVDSTVAALVMRRAGHEVVGVTMVLAPERDPEEEAQAGGCCSLADAQDARRSARTIGVPHYALDMRAPFAHHVIADFEREYLAGRTPNPCVACNRGVKFDALLEKADELGCELLVTGHYARLAPAPEGGLALYAAADPDKDQSYVLYPLRREVLDRLAFPLGTMRKAEVRALAREAGLAVWDKPDSVELCFVGRDYREYLARARPESRRPGDVVDTAGRRVGRHAGVAFYTVGQRRGLGVPPDPDGGPRYVVDIDPETNTVVVGPREEAMRDRLRVEELNWLAPPPSPGEEVAVRVRAHGPLARARVLAHEGEGRLDLALAEPLFAPAPGQAAVLYRGDRVLGGGRLVRVGGRAAARA